MIATVFAPYQWRAQQRDLRQRGAWRGSNVATVIVLACVGLVAQIVLSATALAALGAGETAAGLALAEAGLTGVLIGWILLPILVHSIAGGGAGVVLQRLTQFPLTTGQLLVIGMTGALLQPVYWVLIVTTLLALAPLALAPVAGLGLLAGLLYVTAAAVVSWALSLAASAVMSSRFGREVALTVTAALIFSALPLTLGDVEFASGRATFTIGGREFLLLAADARSGWLVDMGRWLPAARVGAVARGEDPGWALLALAAAVVAGVWLSRASLKRLVLRPAEAPGGRRARTTAIKSLPGVPSVLGVPAVKELRYLLRTLDALLGFAFAVVAAVWMMVRPQDAHRVLVFCLPAIVLNEMVMPLNLFGLDGQAVDRYRLLPLTGTQVILGKNLAFVILVLLEIALPVLVGAWRTGVVYAASAACAALAAVCLMMTWGNQVSVRSPAPRAFFNFDSKEQAGGILSMLGTTLLWLVPLFAGMIARELGGDPALLAAEALLLLVAATLYAMTVTGAGKEFDARAEEMRARLAGQS